MAEDEKTRAAAAAAAEESVTVLDFDLLCANVALQTHGFSVSKHTEGEVELGGVGGGGVQRMWEGDVLDCFDDHRIAVQASCCPCYRFGKNMRRANLGPCFLQGTVYLVIVIFVLLSYVAFIATRRHVFLFLVLASTISFGLYTGYFRTRIRKQFNIKGRGGSSSIMILDDCINHQVCPCCTLCQESRTLEMNNVQDGVWHGRGDAICIGRYGEASKEFSALCKPSSLMTTKSPGRCNMERVSDGHSWNVDGSHSEPLVSSSH